MIMRALLIFRATALVSLLKIEILVLAITLPIVPCNVSQNLRGNEDAKSCAIELPAAVNLHNSSAR